MHNFIIDKWSKNAKDIAIQGVFQKFRGNENIHKVLSILADDVKIVEVSSGCKWGTAVPLSNDHALFKHNWHSDGIKAEVYKVVRMMLKRQVFQYSSHFVIYHEPSIAINYYTFQV